jgi:Lrp/AsnC family transcriptional regulator, leucine-responsive regulatory protein
MVRLDEVNLRILQLLQHNARMTVAEMAQRLGRSESTIRERIQALEGDGFLQGYQARVDWGRVGLPAVAVIRGSCELSKVSEVARQLSAMPHVTQALLLTGPRPIMAILAVRDVQHLHSLLVEHISVGPLTNVEAELALETIIDSRPPGTGDVHPGADLLKPTRP